MWIVIKISLIWIMVHCTTSNQLESGVCRLVGDTLAVRDQFLVDSGHASANLFLLVSILPLCDRLREETVRFLVDSGHASANPFLLVSSLSLCDRLREDPVRAFALVCLPLPLPLSLPLPCLCLCLCLPVAFVWDEPA